MDKRRLLEDIALRSGGVFKTRDAIEAGIHRRDLYALRDGGFLVEISRGVYRLADAEATPYLDLIAVSRRSPQGAICLNSALSYWDLTDEIPAEVHLAVPRGSRPPSIGYPPTHVHVFAAATFDLGRERVRLDSGEEIRIYSPERSVVDAMRLKSQVGADVAYEALRRFLRRPSSSPGDLLRLARRLRAGGPVADALEVLTG
ncbi:MAG: type IV toxin-antitoxin system AbiEi family antitoxin domain-containing protein [Rubrobacter sp.]